MNKKRIMLKSSLLMLTACLSVFSLPVVRQ